MYLKWQWQAFAYFLTIAAIAGFMILFILLKKNKKKQQFKAYDSLCFSELSHFS